ncbi:MAG: 3-oxoacyl-ACP synthase [Betaproteobacteria bacterium]|nr:3-oxoacyl-ACP synthase [Betaproteobacteria bacterium]
MSMPARILIAGSGAVCGLGMDPAAMLDAILAGRSAIAPITRWDATGWPVTHAAEIADFNPRVLVDDRKLHKFIRRTDLVGIYAGDRAAEAAGYAQHRETLDEASSARFADRSGVYVGSGGGAFENQYDYFPLMSETGDDLRAFGAKLAETVNPMWLLRTLPNNVVCHVGIRNRLKGANACITNHSVGGSLAVIEAAEALKAGEADRAIAIGHDTPFEPQNILYYHRCGLLAPDALRPFDAAREGSVLGEGAGALALETEAALAARGGRAIGEVLGGGHVSEATGLLAIRDDGDGVSRAIALALADAGIAAADVGMIVAHGNGTLQSDASEALGIRRVFGDACPPVTAFKWALGHLIAAAGIVEATIALCALRAKVVPGIAPLATPDPVCAGLPISRKPQAPRSDIALVLCRGFAGTDAALLVRALPT